MRGRFDGLGRLACLPPVPSAGRPGGLIAPVEEIGEQINESAGGQAPENAAGDPEALVDRGQMGGQVCGRRHDNDNAQELQEEHCGAGAQSQQDALTVGDRRDTGVVEHEFIPSAKGGSRVGFFECVGARHGRFLMACDIFIITLFCYLIKY